MYIKIETPVCIDLQKPKNAIRAVVTADIQVKVRMENLYLQYEKSLIDIEKNIDELNANLYMIIGDLLEFAEANDAERKLIYNHIARVLSNPKILEIVIMAGNHDLEKTKKSLESNKDNNAIDTFAEFIKSLDPELAKKLIYIKEQKEYFSKIHPKFSYIGYSLEDGMSKGNNIDWDKIIFNPGDFKISLYHDILQEYVDESKLPIKKEHYEKLANLNDFKTNFVIAGDIHKNWNITNNELSRFFTYTGSPIQRNHEEGATILPSKGIVKQAEEKVLKVVDIFVDSSEYYIYDKPLKNYINYIDIDLTQKKKINNVIPVISELITKVNIGEDIHFVKVKSSNLYISEEIEIRKAIYDYLDSQKIPVIKIAFSYEKLIQTDIETNTILAEAMADPNVIAEEKENETEENKESDDEGNDISGDFNNFDLSLSITKLEALFNATIKSFESSLLKNNPDLDQVEEIMSSTKQLFSEQINLIVGKQKNYNIKLLSVECPNGFMNLGSNNIDLDIQGRVRITGTNGIGKTTLYTMIGFALDNVVYEGQKVKNKQKNAMFIFNDKLPENDEIKVLLHTSINDTPVTIERVAIRQWKTSATIEKKRSRKWKESVASIYTNTKVTVFLADKEPTIYEGEQAEKAIEQFFGNVIRTIGIVNQPHIAHMLKRPANEIQEMVMEYIGVEYLKNLETNLETVKESYNLVRPKRAGDVIRNDYYTAEKRVKELNEEKETLFIELPVLKEKVLSLENELNETNKELLSIGNIPNLIQQEESKKLLLQNDLSILESIVLKEKTLPIFDKTEPIKVDEEIILKEAEIKDIREVKLVACITESGELNKSINDNVIFIRNSFDKRLEDQKNIVKTLLENKTKEKNEEITLLEKANNDFISSQKESFNIKLTKIEEIAKLKYTESLSNKNLLDNANKEIAELKDKIESGFCKSCNRVLDNFETIVAGLKEELVSKNNALEILTQNYQKSLSEYEEYNKYVPLLKEVIINLDKKTKESVSLLITEEKFKALIPAAEIENIKLRYLNKLDFISEQKIIAANPLNYLTEEEKLSVNELTNINTVTNNIKLLLDQSKYNEIIISEDYITELSALNLIKEVEKLLVSLQQVVTDFNNKVTILLGEVSALNTQYSNSLIEYQKELLQHNKNVELINKHNISVKDQQNSILNKKGLLLESIMSFDKLSVSLIEYTKLQSLYENNNNILIEEQKILNDLIEKSNTFNIDLVKEEANLNNLKAEYDSYLEYMKNKEVYALYEKIIKKDFKSVIFSYYRKYLNNTLSELLSDVNFKLFWHDDGELYMVDIQRNTEDETFMVHRPVQMVSGMETCFLGLSLIYTIHLLNVRRQISHLFIDEISGQLNSGKELKDKHNVKNYQEEFLTLLSKFDFKSVFIIDHVIDSLYETITYEVQSTTKGSKFIKI